MKELFERKLSEKLGYNVKIEGNNVVIGKVECMLDLLGREEVVLLVRDCVDYLNKEYKGLCEYNIDNEVLITKDGSGVHVYSMTENELIETTLIIMNNSEGTETYHVYAVQDEDGKFVNNKTYSKSTHALQACKKLKENGNPKKVVGITKLHVKELNV